MPKPRKLTPDAYVVIVLRSHLDLSQAELGEVCRVSQSEISKYESGAVPVPEPVLRRMAERARIDGSLIVLLRRFFAHWVPAANRRGARAAEPPGLEMFEPALLAVMPYLIEEGTAEADGKRLEKERREAEETWTALEKHPIPYRRQLLEWSLHASRSCALAARICDASLAAATRDPQEARELAEGLALYIAGRVPEEVRSRAEGYCWAHLAHARRASGDLDGAEEAFALARKLWHAGAASELLPESRMLELEASCRVRG